MLAILSITGPVFLIIAAGFLAVRFGLFDKSDTRVLGRLVVQFCMPALLFHTLSQRSFAEVLNGPYLLAYTVGSVAVLAGGYAFARSRGRPVSLAALQGLGMSGSNSGMIGFPIVQQLVGPPAGVALALCMLVENLLILPATFALADSGSGSRAWSSAVAQSLRGLAKNPMIVAIVAGFAFSLLGWHLPAPAERAVALVAAAAVPLALIVVGGTLVGLSLAGRGKAVATIAVGKLVLHPLAVAAMLWLLPPIDPVLHACAILFAAMPMMGIYPVLAQRWGHEEHCAAASLATTVASFFTISALLLVLHRMPGVPG